MTWANKLSSEISFEQLHWFQTYANKYRMSKKTKKKTKKEVIIQQKVTPGSHQSHLCIHQCPDRHNIIFRIVCYSGISKYIILNLFNLINGCTSREGKIDPVIRI